MRLLSMPLISRTLSRREMQTRQQQFSFYASRAGHPHRMIAMSPTDPRCGKQQDEQHQSPTTCRQQRAPANKLYTTCFQLPDMRQCNAAAKGVRNHEVRVSRLLVSLPRQPLRMLQNQTFLIIDVLRHRSASHKESPARCSTAHDVDAQQSVGVLDWSGLVESIV